MAQATWEKPIGAQLAPSKTAGSRWKFLIGGGLILAAVAYLVITGTLTGAQYFITVNDLMTNPAYVGKSVRVTGAVLGDSIQYDEKTLLITFTIANVPTQGDNLGQALHDAVSDPNATHLSIRVENTLKPELLKNEAQAILTGMLGSDGIFRATELNLKCPSKFIESGPSAGSVAPLQEEQVKVGAGA
ncbi:MAG: hypothetical protein GC204_09440 [Chloroflexi bacterium]|nr:hypothetical protein [Chloroflexota bacterium]